MMSTFFFVCVFFAERVIATGSRVFLVEGYMQSGEEAERVLCV